MDSNQGTSESSKWYGSEVMRRVLFLVGIALSGCKDKQPAKPAEPAASGVAQKPTPVSGEPGAPAQSATPQPPSAPPTLPADEAFDAEARDAAWANSAEQSIEAVAPQLTDVTCKQMQCRVTLTAASEAELVDATEVLQREDSLRGLDGVQHIILTRAEQRDGTHAMKIYVRFDRD